MDKLIACNAPERKMPEPPELPIFRQMDLDIESIMIDLNTIDITDYCVKEVR